MLTLIDEEVEIWVSILLVVVVKFAEVVAHIIPLAVSVPFALWATKHLSILAIPLGVHVTDVVQYP